ncbi:hypothetical protein V6Z11_A02G045200 [Gossypium hirsutum]
MKRKELGRLTCFVFALGQDTAHPQHATKVLIFCQDEFKERLECEICLSELVEGKKARLLPKYNHGFHVVCIHIWFQSHSTCPLYRNPIVVGDEFENSNHLVLGDEANVQVHLQSPNDGFV